MLEYIGRWGEKQKNPDLSAWAKIGLKLNKGEDIPFPLLESILNLEKATTEYKKNPDSPEYLTQFMRSFWAEAGQKIGKSIVVDNFPLTAKDIEKRAKKGEMAIFVPASVNRVDLGKMFPRMNSWAVQEGNSVVDTINNSSWLWIEASVDAPYRNTTQGQLKGKFKKEGKQGQSLRSYIVGGQISKLLTGHYFDEGLTWSRLLGSCGGGWVLLAGFGSDGGLGVDSGWGPELHDGFMGGRSEEVVKA